MGRFLVAWAVAMLIACGGGGGGGPSQDLAGSPDTGGVQDNGTSLDPGELHDPGPPLDPGQTVDPGPTQDPGLLEDPGPTADLAEATDPGVPSDQGSGTYHPQGWATPESGDFHGDEAKQALAACTACHGADLAGGSVQVSCEACHGGFKTRCTFCHGGVDTDKGSPPVDIHDQTATTEVTVGAHTAHVMAKSGIASPLDCVQCHVKPSSALDPGHVDGSPAEVLAALGWDRGAATCSTGYCHGNFAGGNASNRPVWTKSDQAPCGSCHNLPPSTGRHPSVYAKHAFMGQDCTNCHNGIANNGATQVLNPALHVNGQKDVALKSGGTWNPTTKTCDPACHGPKTW